MTKGVLIGYEAHRELLQRLEDLEDLQAMHEAEYWAGEGRPFSEIVAELEIEADAVPMDQTPCVSPTTSVENKSVLWYDR